MPGQTRQGRVFVQAGDARDQMRIVPTHRPELSVLRLTVRYPDYLGYASTTQDVHGGKLEVVKGSDIVLRGSADRRLQEATLNGTSLSVAAAVYLGRLALTKGPG